MPPIVISSLKFGGGDVETAPGVRIEPAFSMEANQERRTFDLVTSWLDKAELK